jgi:hypothetical protein
MKRTVVLFGAGASVDYKAPSTASLTSTIEQDVMADSYMRRVGGDHAFMAIKSGLDSYLQSPVNFEQIYHCAHELIFTYSPTPGAVDEFKPILQPFVSNTTGLAEQALRGLCANVIIAEVSRACDNNLLDLGPLARFVETLRADYVTRIYTTNYDDFTLQAVPDLYTGVDSAPRSGPKCFELDQFWRKEHVDCLFHLHGSVHMGFPNPMVTGGDIGELFWFDDRAEALKHVSFSGGAPQRMDGTSVLRTAVITGLEKLSRLQQRPLSHFYAAMARDAMRADVIFVITSLWWAASPGISTKTNFSTVTAGRTSLKRLLLPPTSIISTSPSRPLLNKANSERGISPTGSRDDKPAARPKSVTDASSCITSKALDTF